MRRPSAQALASLCDIPSRKKLKNINMQQIYIPKQNYKVLVRCATFNQSKYIEDALNGFAMQKTTFPYVCLVVDDCSTDSEQEVIKAWMKRECDMHKSEYIEHECSNVILVPHKTNPTCTFAFYLLKKNMHGSTEKGVLYTLWRDHCEFEAICEGDDYWIDSQKLQTQVDYMDSNPDCGLCYSMCKYYNQSKCEFESEKWGGPNESFLDFLNNNTIPTLTILYRVSVDNIYRAENHPKGKNWLMGDYPRFLWYAHNSKIKFINKVTGVYRVLENSACHSKDIVQRERFLESQHSILKYFADLYGYSHLIDDDKFYDQMHRNACMYGDLEREKIYFSKIRKHNFKQIIKHIVCENKFMYNLFGIKMFYTLK